MQRATCSVRLARRSVRHSVRPRVIDPLLRRLHSLFTSSKSTSGTKFLAITVAKAVQIYVSAAYSPRSTGRATRPPALRQGRGAARLARMATLCAVR